MRGFEDFDEEDCETSWTPDEALAEGEWTAEIFNGDDPGDVDQSTFWILAPDGTPCALPTGEDWELDNGDWLAVDGVDRATFTVSSASVPARSGGGIAILVGILLLAAARRIASAKR